MHVPNSSQVKNNVVEAELVQISPKRAYRPGVLIKPKRTKSLVLDVDEFTGEGGIQYCKDMMEEQKDGDQLGIVMAEPEDRNEKMGVTTQKMRDKEILDAIGKSSGQLLEEGVRKYFESISQRDSQNANQTEINNGMELDHLDIQVILCAGIPYLIITGVQQDELKLFILKYLDS